MATEPRSRPRESPSKGLESPQAQRGSQEWGNVETLVYIIAILIVWVLNSFVIYTLVKDIKEERRKSKISI